MTTISAGLVFLIILSSATLVLAIIQNKPLNSTMMALPVYILTFNELILTIWLYGIIGQLIPSLVLGFLLKLVTSVVFWLICSKGTSQMMLIILAVLVIACMFYSLFTSGGFVYSISGLALNLAYLALIAESLGVKVDTPVKFN